MRGDLADVRLADKVFAPHYAAPMACVAVRQAELYGCRDRQQPAVGILRADDAFEVLELAGDHAWGVAPKSGLVGYVDRTALELAPE